MVIIIGLGKTGLSCVDYFLGRGVTPLVMDTRANPPGKEQLPPEVELIHGLDADLLKQAHMIVASPGIALATPELKAAAEFGVRIVGDIELFVRETQTPVIAITGSNGKSTVTTLVGEMIAEAGLKVGVGEKIFQRFVKSDHCMYIFAFESLLKLCIDQIPISIMRN